MKKELKKFWSYGVLMSALMLMPVVSMAQVGIGTVDSISPAVSERYPDAPLPAPGDSAQALSSPTLAQSTVVGFGGRQWVVIGWDGKGVASEPNTATLFLANASPSKPADARFHNPPNINDRSHNYEGSDLQTAINNFYTTGLTEAREKNVIVARNLSGGSGLYTYGGVADIAVTSFNAAADPHYLHTGGGARYINAWRLPAANTFDWYAYHQLRTNGGFISTNPASGIEGQAIPYTGNYHPDHVAGNAVNANLWPLSTAEASLLDGSIRQYNAFWWLRSPGYASLSAANAHDDGLVFVLGNFVYNSAAVRPAFQLNLTSVIFTSTAGAGGKSDATVGNTLHQATSPGGAGATPGVVKLTVISAYDAINNPTGLALSSATTTVGTVEAGDTVNIAYTNATTGANRYVSAVIENASGAVLFYGKLASAATVNNGTASFTVPAAADLPNGNYTIKLFVEEANGDNETDFASAPIAIAMAVGQPTISLTPATNHDFGTLAFGYAAPAAHHVVIANTGAVDTGQLLISLVGAGSTAFGLSGSSISNIAVGVSDSVDVTVNTGLAPGTYTADVHVRGPTGSDVFESFGVSVTVTKANQTLTVAGGNLTRTVGQGDIDLTGHVTSSAGASGGTITYAVTTPGAGASISGTTLSYTSVGTATITASAPGNDNYNAATSVTFTLTVNPATINIAAISGVTAPVTGATPVAAITPTAQYTGTVVWDNGNPATFAASTVYTATITLTPTNNYTLTGVGADFFAVAGATSVSYAAGGNVVTAVFPATLAMPMAGSTAPIPVMGPVGLGLLALALMGLAARRRKGF